MGTFVNACADIPAGGELVEALAAIPALSGRSWHLTRVVGGRRPRTFRLDADPLPGQAANPVYALRLLNPPAAAAGEQPGSVEVAAVRRAAALGLGPAVVAHDPGHGLLLTEWAPGQALTTGELAQAPVLGQVGELMRRLHASPPLPEEASPPLFDLAATRRDYLRRALAGGRHRLPAGYVELAPVLEHVEAALAARPLPAVPCHGDLVPSNIIRTGAGALALIDFEYAADADPAYEIGNFAAAAELNQEQIAQVTRAALGSEHPGQAARVRLFALAAQYTWLAWDALRQPASSAPASLGTGQPVTGMPSAAMSSAPQPWNMPAEEARRWARLRASLTAPELDDVLREAIG